MSDEIEKQKSNKKKRGNPQWAKGTSGNPNGRPKKEHCIPDMLRVLLDEQDNLIQDERTNLESILRMAISQAKGGDRDARNFIADRTEGKAIDRILTQQVDDELILI